MASRRLWIGLMLVGGFSGAVGAAACGSSSTPVSPQDSGTPDSGAPDSTVADSAQPDVGTPDTGSDVSMAEAGACVPFDAAGLDEASVAAGFEQVWKVYRCQGCHQKPAQVVDDAGNGIVLSGNNDGLGDSGTTFPPNLTDDPTTGLGCWTDQQIRQAMLVGKDIDGGNLCPSMPRWGHALLTADGGPKLGTPMDGGTAQEIIDFMRSLPSVVNQVNDTTCPMPTPDGGSGDAGEGGSSDGGDGGD